MGLAVAGSGHLGLGAFEEAAVGRVEARLDDLADRVAGVAEALEADRRRRLPLGPRADPHPGVGDHAEDPLAAEQQPVRATARRPTPAAAGSPRFPAGSPRAPTRPGRRRAFPWSRSGRRRGSRSSRRASRTRTTAGSNASSGRARATAPRAAARSPRPRSAPPGWSGRLRPGGRGGAGRASPSADPRAAARPRRRRWCRRRRGSPRRPRPRPSSGPSPPPSSRAAAPPGRAGSQVPVEAPDDVTVGLAHRPRHPLVLSSVKRSPKASGGFSRDGRTSTSSSGTAVFASPPNPNRARIPAAASAICAAVGAWSSYPQPQCFRRRVIPVDAFHQMREARRPRSTALFRDAPRRLCPSPPASRGRACRPC